MVRIHKLLIIAPDVHRHQSLEMELRKVAAGRICQLAFPINSPYTARSGYSTDCILANQLPTIFVMLAVSYFNRHVLIKLMSLPKCFDVPCSEGGRHGAEE